MAGIFALAMFVCGLGLVVWALVVEGVPKRGLPRADRKRIKDERRRIAVEAEIHRMEREAGL